METESKSKKTYNKYMAGYMKERYQKDITGNRLYRNTLNIKKKYSIDESVLAKYGNFVYNIVTIKELLDLMPIELKQEFLNELPTIEFKKKEV